MRVLVTGATGFLGMATARMLLERGHAVIALGRNATALAALAQLGAMPAQADIRDAAAITAACRRADAVIHAAALSAPWGPRHEFAAINVGGTANVLAGCERHGVGRMVYVSSPSVIFDGRDKHDVTEDAPIPPRLMSVYSETKAQAERLVRASSVPSVIIRPKAIFGPGDTALLPRVVQAARAGRLPQIGAGRNRVDLTYVDNVAHALCLALDAPAAADRTYHITNGEHPLLWDVIGGVLRAVGIQRPLRRRPVPLMLGVARMLELAAHITGREPLLTRYTVLILARTQTYDIGAARRDLGYAPLVPLSTAIERTIAAL